MTGVVDTLLIKLGFVQDTSGLDSFKKKAEDAATSLLKYGGAIGAALGVATVKAIADISDQFEQNTIAIAGFFDALGISGDFNKGMTMAADTMDQITRDAAKLPGEAEEYIEIFRAGLPVIKDAVPNMDVEQITGFTNQIAAIAHTLKVPYEVTSREMQELFVKGEGHATRINILFKRFLPFLRQVQGQADLTTKSFNAMTAEDRVKLFQDSFQKLDPMLKRSADSFDAMKGAIISGAKTLLRKAGEPLFERMKRGINSLNGLFFQTNGRLTATGERVVEVGRQIARMVTQAVSSFSEVISWISKSDGVMTALKVTVGLLGMALAGLAFEKVAKGVGLLVYALTDMKRLFTGVLITAIGLVAEDLWTFETGGESVTGMIVDKLGPAGEWLAKVVLGGLVVALGTLRFAFVRTAIKAAASWAVMLGPLSLLVIGIGAAILVVKYLYDHFNEFSAGAKTAIAVVVTALGVLGAVLIAVKATAIAASVQMAIGFALMASPIYIVIAALLATAATIYLLWKNWDTVTDFMRDKWMTFGAFLINIPVFGPLLAAIIAIGTRFEETVEKMKAAWNSIAKVMGLPTFKEKPAMLGAGEGVRLPVQESGPVLPGGAVGPVYAPWTNPYGRKTGLPAGGIPEGPSYSPAGLVEGKKGGLAAGLKGLFDKYGGTFDLQGMLGGVGGLQPAAYGGAKSAPPQALLDSLGKLQKAGDTNVTQHVNIEFNGDPMNPADIDRFTQQVTEQLREKTRQANQRVIRNVNSGDEY